MSREYSAIDTIYLLLEKMEEQGKTIELMNQNIKELNNKIYILNNRINKIQTEQKTFKCYAPDKVWTISGSYEIHEQVWDREGMYPDRHLRTGT